MKSKASQKNRFLRIIYIPIWALCKARDFYVKSMTEYADKMSYGGVMALPVTSQVSGLPTSFAACSARSSNEQELQDLVWASSARGLRDQQTKMTSVEAGPRTMQLRSSILAMGRIDEDMPCCNFGEDKSNFIGKNEIKYPRSRSHAVSARKLSTF